MVAAWRLYPWLSNHSYLYQLDIHNLAAVELWQWKEIRKHYAHATGLSIKEEPIQVSTLLTIIGASTRRILGTFQFEPVEDQSKISTMLAKFGA